MKFAKVNYPPALLLAWVNGEDVRIINLDKRILRFESNGNYEKIMSVEIACFDYTVYKYKNYKFKNIVVKEKVRNDFWDEYTIILNGEELFTFEEFAAALNQIQQVAEAVNRTGKEKGQDNILEHIGRSQPIYPYNNDRMSENDLNEMIRQVMDKHWNGKHVLDIDNLEFAYVLNNYEQYSMFIKKDFREFFKDGLQKMNLLDHPLFKKGFSRVYIGNNFCHNLFPDMITLKKMLNKARECQLSITVVYPYLLETQVELLKSVIQYLSYWSMKNYTIIELVVNDWGIYKLLTDYGKCIRPVLGTILNRKKKDARYRWLWGRNTFGKSLKQNSSNVSSYQEYLNKLGITRYEYESSPMGCQPAPGRHSLHLPFFQQNTSMYCPLYAECRNLLRTQQQEVNNCPHYCSDFYFRLPEQIHAFGFGNSIFGIDTEVLSNPDIIMEYMQSGIDRLVFWPLLQRGIYL